MHKLGNVRTLGAFFSKNIAMHVTSVTTQMPLKRSAIGALYTAPLNSNLLTPSQGVQLMTSSALTLPEKHLHHMNLLQWLTVHTMYQENRFTEHCVVPNHNITRTESVLFEVVTLWQ